MKKNIIQSATEPDKNSLWLSPQGLKKFSKKGWELIGGNTCGSDTPSDPSSGSSDIYTVPLTFSFEEGEQEGDYLIQRGTLDSTTAKEIIQANKDNKLVQLKFKADESSGIAIVLNSVYYTNENNIEFAMWDGTYIPEPASVMAIKFYIDKESNTYTYSLTLQFKQEEGGGSNDYVLPFTSGDAFISQEHFDEIKEAINSGKTIRYKKENNNCITITHTIIKEDTISLFIGDFDENTIIIYIASGITATGCYITEYNINNFNPSVVHDIEIYDNNGEGVSIQQTGIVNDYQNISGYSLNIFNNSFGKDCILDDGIYNIWYENKRDKRVIGQCIIYTTGDGNGHKIITLIRNEVPDNDLVPGFVYGGEYYINSSNESTELTDFNIYYSNDINLLNSIKNANKEISNTYINNKITKFIFRSYNNINGEIKSTCVYKYNTLDQLYNELYFIDKINNILIIDYSDINDSLPQKYPDITNKLLYITGLWDYTPDNGSLTKRFIPATYTYNGSGSFTINYKVDISGPYEKKQMVGMIYYNGADKIDHTYHTVCPSYTINLNVQDGTNTGTFDNNMIIYREVRQTIYGGGQIVIKDTATTNYVEAEAVATDYIVLRWSVPKIGEDGTSITLSVYELKLTPEDYTTKVVHKTI